ncbi:carboxypeptidase-like regulatory domain-containing protein [Flavobacteriales bacterium]|nr:carboxypeptidase-like regulatory domain-containing protein [Flavobacteriales bacterium]MDB9932484.1 carboxypeptidase-like regulatory domain-containing protein [Flavobacteriales bacterium]
MPTLRHISFIFLLALFNISGFSQDSYTISGKVTDPNNYPVKDALVSMASSPSKYVRTNDKGEYKLIHNYSSPTSLMVNHVGFSQSRIKIDKSVIKSAKNNKITIDVRMSYKTLGEVIIRGKRVPDTVFGSELTSVADYEFTGDYMVLLSYNKSLKKEGYLQLTSKRNTLVTTYRTPPNPVRLFKDFENRIYLITKTRVYLINVVQSEFRLRPVDLKFFTEFTSKIIDTVNQHFLYSDFNASYPAFHYYSQSFKDSSGNKIHKVENKFMMELYRAEYKYAPQKQKLWAFRQELRTGIDKEIWIGASNFTQSLYYEPLYAPLFINNDTVLIFDHYSDYLIKLDLDFNKLDSIPINYHKSKQKKYWEQPLLKDKEEKKLYGLFLRDGYYYLRPINLNDGSTLISFKLRYKYVENVKVENGYVYYIYRPFESSQKKFLYREIIETEPTESN